jgi:hypothetical protein
MGLTSGMTAVFLIAMHFGKIDCHQIAMDLTSGMTAVFLIAMHFGKIDCDRTAMGLPPVKSVSHSYIGTKRPSRRKV